MLIRSSFSLSRTRTRVALARLAASSLREHRVRQCATACGISRGGPARPLIRDECRRLTKSDERFPTTIEGWSPQLTRSSRRNLLGESLERRDHEVVVSSRGVAANRRSLFGY